MSVKDEIVQKTFTVELSYGKFIQNSCKLSPDLREMLKRYVDGVGEDLYIMDMLKTLGFFDYLFQELKKHMKEDKSAQKKEYSGVFQGAIKNLGTLESYLNRVNFSGLTKKIDRQRVYMTISFSILNTVVMFVRNIGLEKQYMKLVGSSGVKANISVFESRIKREKELFETLFQVSKKNASIPEDYLVVAKNVRLMRRNISELKAKMMTFSGQSFSSEKLQQTFTDVINRFDNLHESSLSVEDFHFVTETVESYIPEMLTSLSRLSESVSPNILQEAEEVFDSQLVLIGNYFDEILYKYDAKDITTPHNTGEGKGFLQRVMRLK